MDVSFTFAFLYKSDDINFLKKLPPALTMTSGPDLVGLIQSGIVSRIPYASIEPSSNNGDVGSRAATSA